MGIFEKIVSKLSNKITENIPSSQQDRSKHIGIKCFDEYKGTDRIMISLNEIIDNTSADPILRIKCLKLSRQNYTHIYIQNERHLEMLDKEKQWIETKYIIKKTADINNNGIALEKDGKISEAISVYEEAVKLEVVATHSYDRLMILYRKRGDIENEIRVIEKAITVFTKENERRSKQCIISHPELSDEILKGLVENNRVSNNDGLIVFNPYNILKYTIRLEKLKKE